MAHRSNRRNLLQSVELSASSDSSESHTSDCFLKVSMLCQLKTLDNSFTKISLNNSVSFLFKCNFPLFKWFLLILMGVVSKLIALPLAQFPQKAIYFTSLFFQLFAVCSNYDVKYANMFFVLDCIARSIIDLAISSDDLPDNLYQSAR